MKTNVCKWLVLPLLAITMLVTSCQEESEFVAGQQTGETTVITRALIDIPYEYLEVPDDVIDITTVSSLQAGQSYIILGNYNGNLPHYGNSGEKIVLYVAGTWDVQNWNLENGIDVVVLPLGQLTSTANSSLVINGNSSLYILAGGRADFTNDFLYFSNTGELYVAGTLTATFLQMNSGSFYVAEDGYASIGQLISQGTGQIENDGTLIVAEDGWDEGENAIPVYEYHITYVPGQTLYTVDANNLTEEQYIVSDDQEFGSELNTNDLNSLRLYLPAGTLLTDEDLPLRLTYQVGIDEMVTAEVIIYLE
ncbi:MAG: hypothetical protein LIP08_04240 [Bacteroides sp.]|nr:hypothetical protein [Bacteroides sp.]